MKDQSLAAAKGSLPYLSIAIPTLGRWEHLENTVKSIVASLGAHAGQAELVISYNNTQELPRSLQLINIECQSVSKIHSNLVSVREQFQTLLELSSGQWILFLGNDDPVPSDFMTKLLPALENLDESVSVVMTSLENHKEKKGFRSFAHVFMRSGSMMGLIVRRKAVSAEKMRSWFEAKPSTIYPQASFAVLALEGGKGFGLPEAVVQAGTYVPSVEELFRSRPADLGVGERLEILNFFYARKSFGALELLSSKLFLAFWAGSVFTAFKADGAHDGDVRFRNGLSPYIEKDWLFGAAFQMTSLSFVQKFVRAFRKMLGSHNPN